MIKVEEIEAIRRAYFHEGKSIREIARTLHHGRRLVKRAIADAGPWEYQLQKPRPSPVLGPWQERIDTLMAESKKQPIKQRYTSRRIYQLIQEEGYAGSESAMRRYVGRQRKEERQPEAYLPLEFDPGHDAQVDWGEATVRIAGKTQVVQVFVMRLNHSRVRFVMTFPFQKQEAFFEGHIQAFHFFGGIPRRISYDNLKTAVYRILSGHNRREQDAFVSFRSYHLFESNYCNPGKGHEKGGVENDVGYTRRNFLTPVPEVESFAALNAKLVLDCRRDTHRRMRGQTQTIAGQWEAEKANLLPIPSHDYPACSSHPVKPNPYSQVTFETNRYSVPTTYRGRQLVLKAYSFRVDIVYLDQVIASHERCFEREQDVLDPMHYLSLLTQRPGAFEHAIPMRRWRKTWPPIYEQLLAILQEKWPDGKGLREFLGVLNLHRNWSEQEIEQAVKRCVQQGRPSLDSIQLALRTERDPARVHSSLDLATHPHLQNIGEQPVALDQYDRLLSVR